MNHRSRNRMHIFLTELVDDVINKGSLSKMNGMQGVIAGNRDSKSKLSSTKVGNVPVTFKFSFECVVFIG